MKMIDGVKLFEASKVMKEAYETDETFRATVNASALSAIRELRGSNSDETVARRVVERLFSDD